MSSRWPTLLVLLLLSLRAPANPIRDFPQLKRVNRQLSGQVLDFTHNHGADNRLWSAALCEKRALYVYVPPCYDPHKAYPLTLWLHGVAQDEGSFLRDVVKPLDGAIACGKLPPMIIACPDGSLHGFGCYFSLGSFFNNTKAGAFEDYLMKDVWDFLHAHFRILPERDAHVIAGVSMGGGAAFGNAFKYRDRFKVVAGVFPPLNPRWESCRGRYRDDFDPSIMQFREDFSRTKEVVARFYGIPVRLGQVTRPLYGKDPHMAAHIAAENPLELMVGRDIKPGEFCMYVAYGGRDQFNIDAQVESFLHIAKPRGICPHVEYDPNGKHDRRTALSFVPSLLDWLSVQLAPYKK